MPTYRYQCAACGHELELFQSMSDAPKRKCPACGKSKLERLIGAGAGIIFKGSGFYETDYRSSSYKEGQKGDGAKSDASKSDAPKSDAGSAPAEKSASSTPGSSSSGGTADKKGGAKKPS